MVTTQGIKGGFELKLGSSEGGGAKVHSSQVAALLEKMRASPAFSQAKAKFEFRVQERGGQSFLQLKERNWAGKLKGMLGMSNASEERRAAMDHLESHYGLSARPRNADTHVNTRQALDFQRQHQAQWSQTDQNLGNPFGYSVLPARTEGDVRALLGRSHQALAGSSRAQADQFDAGPLAARFDLEVLKSLSRCHARIEGDRLTLHTGSPADGLSTAQRLQAIVGFVEKHTGDLHTREPEQFQRVLDNLMRNDSFKFSGDVTNQIMEHGRAAGGLSAAATLTSRQTEFQVSSEGFRITQQAAGSVELGGLSATSTGLAGNVASLTGVAASQSFTLGLPDLGRADFNVAEAARDVRTNDALTGDFQGLESSWVNESAVVSGAPVGPLPNPFADE